MRTRAAGTLLLALDTARVLVCKRTDDGTWSVPAGHVEHAEGARHAAARELFEETGYAGPARVTGWCLLPGNFILYVAEIPREFVPVLNHEHSACRWVPVGALPSPLHPGLRAFLGRQG